MADDDGLPAELLKHSGDADVRMLHHLFSMVRSGLAHWRMLLRVQALTAAPAADPLLAAAAHFVMSPDNAWLRRATASSASALAADARPAPPGVSAGSATTSALSSTPTTQRLRAAMFVLAGRAAAAEAACSRPRSVHTLVVSPVKLPWPPKIIACLLCWLRPRALLHLPCAPHGRRPAYPPVAFSGPAWRL
jgi:hypothetical protein